MGDFDLWSARQRLYWACAASPLSAVRHAEFSGIFSLDDALGAPSEFLLDLAEAIIHASRTINLHSLDDRGVPDLIHLWPGEHYRLLAAAVRHLQPKRVVEIGTFTGLSALAMMTELPQDGTLTTFDIVPWREIEGSALRESDFVGSRLTQVIGDPAEPGVVQKFTPLLENADMFFIDGPKDGVFEAQLLGHLNRVGLKKGAVLIFDDVRLWNMLAIWRSVTQPKRDITSFGHWSGTGMVEWQ